MAGYQAYAGSKILKTKLINKQKGIRSIIYANNDKYEGQWKSGKCEGTGTFYWGNGEKYVGPWKNDIMDGNGAF